MIEWIIIGGLIVSAVLLILYIKNLLLTIRNIETMVSDVQEASSHYKTLVETVNKSETYYGDPVIQELVEASNELSHRLGLISDIERQLLGEEDDEENETQEN